MTAVTLFLAPKLPETFNIKVSDIDDHHKRERVKNVLTTLKHIYEQQKLIMVLPIHSCGEQKVNCLY